MRTNFGPAPSDYRTCPECGDLVLEPESCGRCHTARPHDKTCDCDPCVRKHVKKYLKRQVEMLKR